MKTFNAVVVHETDGKVVHNVEQITMDQLSEGDVVIDVEYSSVNYKDMLAVKTNGGVIRSYPMIPGIDLAGTVISSEDESFHPGQKVLVTGFDVGMSHTGGYSEYVRVPSKWVVPVPENLTCRDVMMIGTAGFTAALSIMALEKMGLNPQNNQSILVTGASGGVGSIALQLLAASGYTNIYALSRSKEKEEVLLKKLGAKEIVATDEVIPADGKNRPLGKQKFHYILDTVGGSVASALIPQIYYSGSISMCGNAGGIKLDTTVLPMILRSVNILGIDSVNFPIELRAKIWERFAKEWRIMDYLLVDEVNIYDLPRVFESLQNGTHIGRTIVKIG